MIPKRDPILDLGAQPIMDNVNDASENHDHYLLVPEAALLSEAALADDWNRPEEDAAWEQL